jgi:hypothetical protein
MGGIDTGGGGSQSCRNDFDTIEAVVYGFAVGAERTETLPKQPEESILD